MVSWFALLLCSDQIRTSCLLLADMAASCCALGAHLWKSALVVGGSLGSRCSMAAAAVVAAASAACPLAAAPSAPNRHEGSIMSACARVRMQALVRPLGSTRANERHCPSSTQCPCMRTCPAAGGRGDGLQVRHGHHVFEGVIVDSLRHRALLGVVHDLALPVIVDRVGQLLGHLGRDSSVRAHASSALRAPK